MARTRTIILALVAAALVPGAALAQAGKKYAVLVGVSEYQHEKLKKLRFTENDAAELADVLRSAGYEVKLLTDSEGKKDRSNAPTKSNIEQAISEILKKCQKSDTVMIALAGHGLQFQDKPDSYFCPPDAKPFADEIRSLVSVTQIYAELEKSLAGVKVLLVDACRDDPTAARGATRGIDADSAPRPPRGVAALFSCSAGELSYEHDRFQHGVFFHFVLEGLRKEAKERTGEVTFDGLSKYVRESVAREIPRLIGGGAKQSPNLKADLSGVSPVLVGHNLSTRRPNIGVFYVEVSKEEAESLGLRPGGQARIQHVVTGGAGDRLGLQVGDVFLKIDGRVVRNAGQVTEAFRKSEFAVPTEIMVRRGNEDKTLQGKFELTFGMAELIRRLEAKAREGDANAQCYLALSLQQADPSLQNPVESLHWCRKALDQDNVFAMTVMANRLQNGTGVPKDLVEAAKLYRRVADTGRPTGAFRYGRCLEFGLGIEKNIDEAISWYRKAADQDQIDAIMSLARLAVQGKGMPKDAAEALKWYRKGADLDHPDAVYQVGYALMNGLGADKNEKEAVEFLKRAADLGSTNAANDVGRAHFNGTGVPKDVKEGLRWFERAANQNNLTAQLNLARTFYQGKRVNEDKAEAARWYQRAAAQNSAEAQFMLGKMYLLGQGVQKDETAGFALIQKADAQSYLPAKVELGRCHERGIGTARKPLEAVAIYKKAAELESLDAMIALGRIYERGNGIAKNDVEALKWFRRGAEKNSPECQFFVGLLTATGRGTEVDFATAIKWYRKAADAGYPDAMTNLGVMHEYGQGVNKDQTEAIKWYKKASERGEAIGQINLAICYLNGQGVDTNPTEAVRLFRAAADRGNSRAQFFLGACYEKGQGIEKNQGEALKWYQRAAGQGHNDAVRAVNRLTGAKK